MWIERVTQFEKENKVFEKATNESSCNNNVISTNSLSQCEMYKALESKIGIFWKSYLNSQREEITLMYS